MPQNNRQCSILSSEFNPKKPSPENKINLEVDKSDKRNLLVTVIEDPRGKMKSEYIPNWDQANFFLMNPNSMSSFDDLHFFGEFSPILMKLAAVGAN